MSPGQRRCVILHHVEQSIVGSDIRVFFEHSLGAIFRHRPFLASYSYDAVVDRLVERADGLFIWAATACRFIKDGGPQARRRLDVLVQHESLVGPGHPEQKLDQFYASVLRNAVRQQWAAVEQEQFCRSLNNVLGTITVLSSLLAVTWLAALLFLPEIEVLDVLSDLHSIIDVPADRSMPIRPQHASVRDFLLNKERCTDARFWVDEHKAHARDAQRCLQLMTTCLKKDICGLREPGVLREDVSKEVVDGCISSSLRYACLYWVEHVKQSDNPHIFRDSVNSFIREPFPHWLEVLTLLDKLSDGLEMLALLSMLFHNDNLSLSPLLADAKRFVLYNRRLMEEAPLQLYYSALIFAPSRSVIRQIYLDKFASWLGQLSQPRDDWGEELLVLQGDGAVAFSPDGLLIASACSLGVKLWNLNTGATYGSLEGHTGGVTSLAFSPNGLQLASASHDKSIRLWSVKTGAANFFLEGHLDVVEYVAFSPNGFLLASASWDKTVKLWNPSTGGLCSTIQIVSNSLIPVKSVAFTNDNNLVVVVAGGTIEHWDTRRASTDNTHISQADELVDNRSTASRSNRAQEARVARRKLGVSVSAAAFSHDGSLLATESGDEVMLWDVRLGNQYRSPLHLHPKGWKGWDMFILAVSPNHELLAVGSRFGIVDILDIRSGSKCASFSGHSSAITCLAFSLNGHLLASTSPDGTTRLWDIKASATHCSFEVRQEEIKSLIFAPDHLILAIVYDRSVELWDGRAAALRWAFHQPDSAILASVEFSPDSKMVAILSSHALMLCDAATGTARRIQRYDNPKRESISATYGEVRPFDDDTGDPCVAFSPDSLSLASGYKDGTVRLWDVATCAARGILEGHSRAVRCIAFSPTGNLLAASDDRTVRLWNRNTGALRHTLNGAAAPPTSVVQRLCGRFVAFSPDGRSLACAATDIRLWDVESGALRHSFGFPSAGMRNVAFSPDGQLIALI